MQQLKLFTYWLTFIGLFIAAFFLPIKTSLSNTGLLIFLSSTVFSFLCYGWTIKKRGKRQNLALAPWMLYVPIALGILYTTHFIDATREASKLLFLLLIPLALLRKDIKGQQLFTVASFGLALGALLSATLLLYSNFNAFFQTDLPLRKLFSSYYTGFKFTEPFKDMHPVYMGSYYLMACLFIMKKNIWKRNFLILTGVGILLLAILFLNSRITFGLALLFVLFFSIRKIPKKLVFALGIVTVLTALLTYPFYSKTYIYNKAINATVWDLSYNVNTHNTDTKTTSDSRMSRWVVGWEAFMEKSVIGSGTGTENEVLIEKYKQHNMKLSEKKGYNSHNQYLGYLVRFGIIGGLCILVYIIGNGYIAIKEKNVLYIGYIIILSSVFLVENYIDRNMGINFVALFGTLLCLKKANKSHIR